MSTTNAPPASPKRASTIESKTNSLLITRTIPIHLLDLRGQGIGSRTIKHTIENRIDIKQPDRRRRIQLPENPRHHLHRVVELRDIQLQLRALYGGEVEAEGDALLGVDAEGCGGGA